MCRHGHEHQISDEGKQDIADRVIAGMQKSNIEDRRRNIIRIAESDKNITSIGVDTKPRKGGPRVVIARHEFPLFGAALDLEVGLPHPKKIRNFTMGWMLRSRAPL